LLCPTMYRFDGCQRGLRRLTHQAPARMKLLDPTSRKHATPTIGGRPASLYGDSGLSGLPRRFFPRNFAAPLSTTYSRVGHSTVPLRKPTLEGASALCLPGAVPTGTYQ